jgi:hypothetical protein
VDGDNFLKLREVGHIADGDKSQRQRGIRTELSPHFLGRGANATLVVFGQNKARGGAVHRESMEPECVAVNRRN